MQYHTNYISESLINYSWHQFICLEYFVLSYVHMRRISKYCVCSKCSYLYTQCIHAQFNSKGGLFSSMYFFIWDHLRPLNGPTTTTLDTLYIHIYVYQPTNVWPTSDNSQRKETTWKLCCSNKEHSSLLQSVVQQYKIL